MTMSVKFESFQEKVFRQVLKTTYCWGPGDRDGLFEKLYIPLNFSSESLSELERKTVGFSRKILEMVTKPHSTLPENLFKRVCIFYTLILFYICRSGAIKIQLFRDKFRQMHKYCILRVQRNNLGNYVFWNKKTSSKYLGHWAGNCGTPGKLPSAGVLELNSVCPRKPIHRSLLL